jgi:hypothetical protein
MGRSKLFATIAGAVVSVVMMVPHAAADPPPESFVTSARPFLVPRAPDVLVQPVLTTGDVVGTGDGAYQMSGVPDGIGWYTSAPNTFEVYVNHELHQDYDPSGSRVSHITFDADGGVTAGEYVVDGTEGYEWFCASSLDIIHGVPWYTTGEESAHSEHDGVSIAINASTGRVHETPWFGHLSHENVVPVEGLSKAFVGLSEDGSFQYSQYFAYMAETFDGAVDGSKGALFAWVPDHPVKDGAPSANDIRKGDVVRGHFERIPHAADMLSLELDKTAVAMGAWGFDRIEDQIDDPNHPGTIYFAETGRAHAFAPNGRVYKLEVDPEAPKHAALSVVLDSRRDDLASPDNLGISARALVIQEDRNWKQSGYNRVLAYDLATGGLTEVARTDPPDRLVDKEGPAAWESSGVVSVEDAFGPGWWLLDVQAHDTRMDVPDRTLVPNTATGEGGQLDLVFIPGT